MVLVSVNLFGAWLNNQEVTVYQTDGQKIECFASGDEFHNWLHDANGYTIISHPKTGDYVWADKKGDRLTASEYRVDKYDPKTLGLMPRLNISKAEYLEKKAKFMNTTRDFPSRAPTQGIINNLVIFIRFSNDTEFNQNISSYNTMLNDSSATGNSMKNYFREVSYQTLSVTSSFYPIPVNSMIVSYQDINPRSYYLPYSASNTNGYSEGDRVQREHQLLKRAAEFVADQVPDDLNLDGDNDGRVDNVCYIIKGSAGGWSDLLWPHRWSLFSESAYINGKRVWDFNFQLQNSLSSSGSSVLSHEMFHSLGAPDLYRYENEGNPIGAWDLMASNTTPPQHMGAYMKFRYGNWIDSIPVINTSGQYYLKTIKSPVNNCYRINSPYSSSEYFVIEYRNNEMGMFDSQIYGSGLLVYRVNDDYSGQGNASGPPDELYVYRPQGTVSSDGNIQSAFFSQESARTQINDATDPNCFLYQGGYGGLNIYNIGSATGDSIGFYVQIMESNANDIDEDFENSSFSDYDWDNTDSSPWTITSNGYQSSHTARSGVLENNQSSELKMTLNVSFGFVQFYCKTSTQQNSDYLRFYIDDVEKGSWSGTNGWTHVSHPVSAGIHEFKWVYSKDQSGSFGSDAVFVDRIGFPEFVGPVYYAPRNLSNSVSGRNVNLVWNKPIPSMFYPIGQPLAYEIYKNNTLLASVTSDTSFADNNVEGGSISYFVKAIYQNGTSLPSNASVAVVPYLAPMNLSAGIVNHAVVLNWQAPASAGRNLAGYKVFKNGSSVFSGVIEATTYTDPNVSEGSSYSYYVKAVYQNPTALSPASNTINITVNPTDTEDLIKVTRLDGNYPNPFNPSTTVSFSLKSDAKVKLSVYNVKGELVKTLADEEMKAGRHSIIWNGTNLHNKQTAAGIYFLKMSTPDYTSNKKMIMLK
jgi:M6 family metalloprotease-like protein